MNKRNGDGKMKGKMKLLGELFAVFFRIGLFTFGGGYAMIPLIEREVVEGKKWISSDDVLDMLAIAESTPGPLAVNSATFVGYRMGGAIGSAVATIALAIPSVVIICIISLFITACATSRWSKKRCLIIFSIIYLVLTDYRNNTLPLRSCRHRQNAPAHR